MIWCGSPGGNVTLMHAGRKACLTWSTMARLITAVITGVVVGLVALAVCARAGESRDTASSTSHPERLEQMLDATDDA